MDSVSSDSFDSDRLQIDEDYLSTPTYGQSPSTSACEMSPPISGHEKSPSNSMYEKSPVKSTYKISPLKSTYEKSPSKSTYEEIPIKPLNEKSPLKSTYEKSSLTFCHKQGSSTSQNGYLPSTTLYENGSLTSANELFALMATNGPFLPLSNDGGYMPPTSLNDRFPLAFTYGHVPPTSTPTPSNETMAIDRRSARVCRTRHKRSLTEGNQSTNSRTRIYKKFQNLPEDVAEIKRLKVNEQERDRQRKLCDAFWELKQLNMPNIPVDDGNKSDSKYHLLRCALSFIKTLKQENADLEMKLKMTSLMQRNSMTTRDQTTQTGSDKAKDYVLENGKSPINSASRKLISANGQDSLPKFTEHFLASRVEQDNMPNAGESLASRMDPHAMPNERDHFLAPRTDEDIMHLASRTAPEILTSSSQHAATGSDENIAPNTGKDIKVEGNDSHDGTYAATINRQPNHLYKTQSVSPLVTPTPHMPRTTTQETVQQQRVLYPNLSAEDLQKVYVNQLKNPLDTQAWNINSIVNNHVASASHVPESNNFPPMACFANKFYVYNNVMPPIYPNFNHPIAIVQRPAVQRIFPPPTAGVQINAGSFPQNLQNPKAVRLVSRCTLNTPGYSGEGTPSSSSGSDTQQTSPLNTSSSGSDFETLDTRPFGSRLGMPAKSSLHNVNFNMSKEPKFATNETEDGIHFCNANFDTLGDNIGSDCGDHNHIQPCSSSIEHPGSFSIGQLCSTNIVQPISYSFKQPGSYCLQLPNGFNHNNMTSGYTARGCRPTTPSQPRHINTSSHNMKTSHQHPYISATSRHYLNLKTSSYNIKTSPHHPYIPIVPRHSLTIRTSPHNTKMSPT